MKIRFKILSIRVSNKKLYYKKINQTINLIIILFMKSIYYLHKLLIIKKSLFNYFIFCLFNSLIIKKY